MATLNPPGLACIAPYDGLVDQYRCSNYHGGIYLQLPHRAGTSTCASTTSIARPASQAARRMRIDLVGDDRRRIRSTTTGGASARRSGGSHDIKVPVLSIGHWGKMGLHLRGNILGYEGVKRAEEARRHRRAQRARGASSVRPDRIPREGVAAVLRRASQGHRQRRDGRAAGAALRARRQDVARRTGMAARSARPTCRCICARVRPAA